LSSNDTYRRWIVAEVEGKVVGYAFAEIIDDSRILQVLNVHPEYFGKGVGQALIDSAIKWLGGNNVELTVVKHNHRAIKFYQKNGFVIDGEAYDEAAMLPSGKVMPEWRMVKNIK
jgi:putative acetyltransferase